jgi:hypothetical protein
MVSLAVPAPSPAASPLARRSPDKQRPESNGSKAATTSAGLACKPSRASAVLIARFLLWPMFAPPAEADLELARRLERQDNWKII